VRTPEQIALEVISQFPWSDNVVYRGALVGKQHAVAKTIADAIREDRAECKTNFFDESIPEPLILNTETGVASRGGRTVMLTPRRARLLQALLDGGLNFLTVANIFRALGGPKTAGNNARVTISELRALLEPLHVSIYNRHGVGYRLELHPVTPEVTE
jgi:DNA-binding response OmpR family regulator